MDFGEYINGLISEVERLFGANQKFVAVPSHQTTSMVTDKVISSLGTYTAPIHGSWASSGGFTYQASGSHPKGHMGLDLRAPGGTAVYSIAPGIVSNVGTDPEGGNVVNVQHANGVKSYYAHMSTVKVQNSLSNSSLLYSILLNTQILRELL